MEAYCMKCKEKREIKDPVAGFNAKKLCGDNGDLSRLWDETFPNGEDRSPYGPHCAAAT